nr:MAG TPA: DNA primase small subunit [Caudoviricetes sp.]
MYNIIFHYLFVSIVRSSSIIAILVKSPFCISLELFVSI